MLGCRQVLPPELEREILVLDFKLPGTEELGVVLDNICESAQLPVITGEPRERILDAVRRFDPLIGSMRKRMGSLHDRRKGKNKKYTMEDIGLSAFSVFYTQCPSIH